jgi:Tol biopolymer transport system component
LPADLPPPIRHLIERCLERDPRRRLRDIGDARHELNAAPLTTSAPSPRIAASWRRLAWFVVTVFAGVTGAIAALAIRPSNVPVSGPPIVTAGAIATQLTNYGGRETSVAVSPDGRSFVFVSEHGGTPDIWLRQVSGGEPLRLTNDAAEEAHLAYAPDGESVYFTRSDADGMGIWQIAALGGQPRKIIDDALKPTPSPDGRRLAYAAPGPPANRLEDRQFALNVRALDGSEARTVVGNLREGGCAPRPAWSPDGTRLAYSTFGLFGPHDVFVVEVATGEQKRIARLSLGFGCQDAGEPVWLRDNRHLLISYLPVARQQAGSDLGIVDVEDGSISRLTMSVGNGFTTPSISADGSRVLAIGTRYAYELWKVPLGPDPDASGRAAVRLLDGASEPMWTFVSRDGRLLLFNSPLSGSRNLWLSSFNDRSGARQVTAVPGDAVAHSSLSPDGTRVAFASIGAGHSDIWTQRVDGSDLRQLTNDEAADSWPVWSPDGEWIVFNSDRDSRRETHRIRATGGSSEKLFDGFFRGDWARRPDGDGTLMVRTGPEVVDVEKRTVIWDQNLPGGGGALPVFSRDARSISAVFAESREGDVVRIFDSATGKARVAARLPFHVIFRANWVDGDRALVVNRLDRISHVVMFDGLGTDRAEANVSIDRP